MKPIRLLIICLYLLSASVALCQQPETINSTCGLYSPHQVDLEKFLRFNNYSSQSGMNIEVGNYAGNKCLEVDLLLNIFSSGDTLRNRVPLNLCFALDRSASMEENNRLEKLKIALKQILPLLTSDDYISIVVYDDVANVVLPSRKYNKDQDSVFQKIIDEITLGAGTNMLAGMLKGYAEVSKNYTRFYKNRLILMSDGVSTTGERTPEKILRYATANNHKGIETSSIGLGGNINFELLHNIAVEGKGMSHFIGDCDSVYNDITYVLKNELGSMNTNMENIKLELSYPKHFELVNVYGVSKVLRGENLVLYSSSLLQQNQFMLVRFKTKKENNRNNLIKINLTYTENGTDKNVYIEVPYVDKGYRSYQMSLTKQIIEAINCVKTNLHRNRKDLLCDCLNNIDTLPEIPDNITYLKQLITH